MLKFISPNSLPIHLISYFNFICFNIDFCKIFYPNYPDFYTFFMCYSYVCNILKYCNMPVYKTVNMLIYDVWFTYSSLEYGMFKYGHYACAVHLSHFSSHLNECGVLFLERYEYLSSLNIRHGVGVLYYRYILYFLISVCIHSFSAASDYKGMSRRAYFVGEVLSFVNLKLRHVGGGLSKFVPLGLRFLSYLIDAGYVKNEVRRVDGSKTSAFISFLLPYKRMHISVPTKPFRRLRICGREYLSCDAIRNVYPILIENSVNINMGLRNVDAAVSLSSRGFRIKKYYEPYVRETCFFMMDSYVKSNFVCGEGFILLPIYYLCMGHSLGWKDDISFSGQIDSSIEACQRTFALCMKLQTMMLSVGCTMYVPHSIDFRYRIYSSSLFSPIYNKELRAFYEIDGAVDWSNFGNYEYERKYLNVMGCNGINEYVLSVISVEIGKLFKSELVSSSSRVYLSDMFLKGLDVDTSNMDTFLNKLDLSDYNYLRVLCWKREEFISSGVVPYIPQLLDSTASGQQVISMLTHFGDSLNDLNLSNDLYWVDTYTKIFNDFTSTLPSCEYKLCKKYFNRSIYKGPIMTLFYNVSDWGFKKKIWDGLYSNGLYFRRVHSLPKSVVISECDFASLMTSKKLSASDRSFLKAGSCYDVYRLHIILLKIEVDVVALLSVNVRRVSRTIYSMKNVRRVVINRIIEKFIIYLKTCYIKCVFSFNNIELLSTYLSNFNINFDANYYKNDGRVYKVIIPHNRKSYTYLYSPIAEGHSIDHVKTGRAFLANIVHNGDAMICGYVISNVCVYTIHDMFITDISQRGLLFDTLNDYYVSNGKKCEYSLTILF